MAKKSRTRVVVTHGGIQKELFSVRERTNGDLVIIPRSEKRSEFMGQIGEVKGEHISIHRSKKSSGFTIKTTINLDGKRHATLSQFRYPGVDGFSALINGHATADLSDERYTANPRTKDSVVNLYNSDVERGGSSSTF